MIAPHNLARGACGPPRAPPAAAAAAAARPTTPRGAPCLCRRPLSAPALVPAGRRRPPRATSGKGQPPPPPGESHDDAASSADKPRHQQQQQPQSASLSASSPPAAAAALSSVDAPPYSPGFLARRWVLFAGLVIGYLSLYLSRLTLTYAAPVMVADAALGLTKADIGLMASAFPTAYGLSKFCSGMLGAAFSPRLMLAGGVAITAALNLVFGATTSVGLWAALWALNGALQGAGAPACAMLLSRWYPPRERGTYWGAWNAGSNLGGFLAPLLVGGVAAAFGWRAGFFVPGVWGVCAGAALLWALADDPVRLGFAPPDPQEAARAEAAAVREDKAHGAAVEAARQERRKRRQADDAAAAAASAASSSPSSSSSAGTTTTGGGSDSSQEEEEEETPAERRRRGKRAALASSFAEVVRNRGIWLLAVAYFFVYVVRQGATSWLVFYLIEEKGVASAAEAAARVSGLELGGLLGGTLAGVASDRAIRAAKARQGGDGSAGAAAAGDQQEEEGLVGKRVRVTMAYAAAALLALAALRALPAGAPPAVLWLVIACLGFCIYGPQMLIGLCGAELVTPAAVGASQGVLGLVSYAGAANAGAPLAHLQRLLGWDGYFLAMSGASVMAVLLLAPLANAKSRVQTDRAAAAKAGAA